VPTILDYIKGFGWTEFWITLAITILLVGIRERHHFFKKDSVVPGSVPPSNE